MKPGPTSSLQQPGNLTPARPLSKTPSKWRRGAMDPAAFHDSNIPTFHSNFVSSCMCDMQEFLSKRERLAHQQVDLLDKGRVKEGGKPELNRIASQRSREAICKASRKTPEAFPPVLSNCRELGSEVTIPSRILLIGAQREAQCLHQSIFSRFLHSPSMALSSAKPGGGIQCASLVWSLGKQSDRGTGHL